MSLKQFIQLEKKKKKKNPLNQKFGEPKLLGKET